jgi:hypothetical protein
MALEELLLGDVVELSFPQGTTITYNWSVNGVAVGSGASLLFEMAEGDNTVTLDQVDANGAALEPQLTRVYNVTTSVPVLLKVAKSIAINDFPPAPVV